MPRGSVTPASSWGANWGTGVSRSGGKWSANFIAAGPSIFTKAAAAVAQWQAAVASPIAAQKFVGKLQAVNFSTVTATVNGAGQAKYISAGTNKQANFQHFAGIFQPKLASIVSALPARGPRGSAQNRARLNQLLDAVEATRGHNF